MPRRARQYIPDLPYHIVQRGNNRGPCFLEPANYREYLSLWQRTSARYNTRVHAFCLMTNHVHFLVSATCTDAISRTFSVVGSNYASYINRRYERTGTLWEGRHKASLIQTESYLFTCYRYIELNPVRARMVAHPRDYNWSSYRFNALGQESWLTPHPEYLGLGESPTARCHAYQRLMEQQLNDEELHRIRAATHHGLTLGNDRFQRYIEQKYGIKAGYMKAGRPRKELSTDEYNQENFGD